MIEHVLLPGEQLIEEELAKRFQVSRTPIRQALQRLTVEGFVEFIPYRGAFVKTLAPDELKDLFQVRMALERLAAQLCCTFLNDEIILKLKENLRKAKKALSANDITLYAELDEQFHHYMMTGCRNKEAQAIAEQLNQKTYIFRLRSFALPSQMEKSFREHEQIVAHIEKRDVETVGIIAEQHVKGVLDAFYEYLKLEEIFGQARKNLDATTPRRNC